MNKFALSNLKKSVLLSTVVGVFLFIIIALYSVSINTRALQEKLDAQYAQDIQTNLNHIVEHFLKKYASWSHRIIETTNISSLLEKGDREAAYTLLQARFELMQKENKYLNVIHIHQSDGVSFLRLHKPEVYGDNIAKTRPMIREIHKNHKLLFGYEVGAHATVYRIITPIFNKNNKYIGAFEIGLEPKFLEEAIYNFSGLFGIVLVKANEEKPSLKPGDKIIDGYILQSNLNANLQAIFEKIHSMNTLKNNIEITVDDKRYLTHLILLKSFSGKENVKIIFFQDITKLESIISTPIYKFYGIIFIIFLFITFFIYRRIDLHEKNLNKNTQKMQEELEYKQKYLEAIFNATSHIMITTNGEDINKANRTMLDFFDFKTLEEFKGKHKCICEFFLEDNDCIGMEVGGVSWLEYILNNPNAIHKVCMQKDGKSYYFLLKAEDLKIDDKKRTIVTFNDISELEKLNQRLEIAVSGTNDGLWDWNLQTNNVYFSPQWKEMLGFSDDELENTLEVWKERVHPDDLEKAIEDIEKNVSGETELYENVHRLQHKNGSWVWILDRGQTKYDKNGKSLRMVGFHTDITEIKRLEEKLYKSEELFNQFMEYVPANVCISKNNSIVYANKSTHVFFEQESLVGKEINTLLKSDELELIEDSIDQALENGVHEGIVQMTNAKGELRNFRNLAFRINKEENDSRVVLFSLDITDEYRSNQEIQRVLSAFERSDISVLMTDIDGIIEYVNPSWCRVTGYSKEELIGVNPSIVKSGYVSDEKYAKMWKQLKSGKVFNSEIKNIAKDGHEFWEDSTIIPSFDKDANVDGFIAFKVEINEKILLKQELKDKDEIMIAQSRHAAMGEMISMIAHQWRQPISVIAMDANNILVDIELDILDKDDLQTGARDIIFQTAELSKTIDDFREFFKPNKNAEVVQIKDVIDDAFSILGKSLQNNSIDVTLNIDESIKVSTYARELMQVIINIIKNAKEILIEKMIEYKSITINLSKKKDLVLMEISDNAGGVSDTIIDKIFDPYFSTKDKKNGTGLGLYMSKTIIEKHLGGSLSVSNTDEGAMFKIILPMSLEVKRSELDD